MTKTVTESWEHIPDDMNAFLAKLAPGTVVRHRNPELADWEGHVVTLTRGPHKGEHLHKMSYVPVMDVRIAWHAGTAGDGSPLDNRPGWYPVTAICPV